MCVKSKLTILFEDPFWIGVYERILNGKMEVSKVVFGAEPKDYEVYEFFLRNWPNLKFSPPIEAEKAVEKKINPKRIKRQINKQLSQKGIGTKAQQALKLQQEERKKEKSISRKQKRAEEEQRKYELKQQKKKEKHKGR